MKLAYIRDAFDRDKVDAFPVVRASHASFDYADGEHVFRIHAAYDADHVYSAAVASVVR